MLKKYWFFVGIFFMICIAFFLPFIGRFVNEYHILNIGIFLAFFLTGLTLETSSILKQMKDVKVLVAALFSSLIFFPVFAYFMGRLFLGNWPDFAVGVLIIGAAPVTVASGTVMTAIALGNVPLSLFICVFGNFFSILTIPFILSLLLRFGEGSIELPVAGMLMGLTIKVLIPTIIGQCLRPWVKQALTPLKAPISIFNQCIVLLIILNAVSSSARHILEVGPVLFIVFAFMIALHIFMLLFNRGLSAIIGLDKPSTAAFTIHTSQKTLTVSYLVWAGYFAVSYPMALIPGIAYHLTQMIMDTFVAHWFKRKAQIPDDLKNDADDYS